ncbi:MAG: 16S rRNA (adenine(1518)-N(6)/adenine(1519)-N(6))-dimethyltransferase RsmA [Patescibacteria group bacterium]|nr:16S rRNA (adenine(1518)-N(6)/adenine(1519)-N(6))-dimethyltransferase RsmA [Patescibacteria group bacterium]
MLLSRHATSKKKGLGQHFLKDKQIIRTLVSAANISSKDTIIEIGAGTGSVTKEIAKKAGRVFAIEFDRDLIPILENNLQSFNNVTIINKDILKIDFSALGFGPPAGGLDLKIPTIVGSIPFQITSPLLHKLIFENNWALAVLLVQKEVAKKITAKPPQASYLSNFVQGFTSVQYLTTVSKTAFHPAPKVDGALIKLDWNPHIANIESKKWSSFLHQGFKHPRKMIRSAFPEKQLQKAGIDPRSRPQELEINQWAKLYKEQSC